MIKNNKRSEEYKKNKSEYDKKYRLKNKERLLLKAKKDNRTITGRFSNAKSNAKKRNILFELTLEDYSLLIKNNCYYCNGYFGKVETQTGLDRIDSSKGYTLSNCVSCCTICNRTKGAHFTMEETKIAINAIINFRNTK